jgi:anti-sigma B factor antagonist
VIPLLSTEIREASGSGFLILSGELDDASVDAANRALGDVLGRGLGQVMIDLRDLEFMDSTGVKFLIDARDTAQGLGVKLTIAYERGLVERVLTVSGVATLFERGDGA